MYVYVCDACLDGRHGDCEESTWKRDGVGQAGYGGGACVCSHSGRPETKFEQATRERSEVSRRHRP